MTNVFYDRFSGRTAENPDGEPIVGRWLVACSGNAKIYMNAVPVTGHNFLVTDSSNHWTLTLNGQKCFSGTIPEYQIIDDVEADSIRNIGALLEADQENGKSWNDWQAVVPLDPGLSDMIKIRPFDQKIEDFLWALETVCMKPHAHLAMEVDRLLISKARRIPVRASSYLASHTEDWDRRLIRSVLPKRILSEIRYEKVDIYENRVAARLVDHLIFYLSRRILEIKKALKVIQDTEDYSDSIKGSTHWRMKRIMELWGDMVDNDAQRKMAETSLLFIKGLYYRLMSLMDSPLYNEIPRRIYVPPSLRMTNILANDQNYRCVALLWKAWVRESHRPESSLEKYRESQLLCEGMDRFAMLLIVRALGQLGCEISGACQSKSLQCNGTWEICRYGQPVILSWAQEGMIHIESLGKRLTFIATPSNLGNAQCEDHVKKLMDDLRNPNLKQHETKVVLYCGNDNSRSNKLDPDIKQKIYTVGNDPRRHTPEHVGLLPVSPWDIASADRVARSLRWFLDKNRLEEWPQRINVSQFLINRLDGKNAGWMHYERSHKKLILRRPPEDYEWDLLDVKGQAQKIRRECETIKSDIERKSSDLSRGIKTRRLMDQKQQLKRGIDILKQSLTELERGVAEMERFENDLETARVKAKSLSICPVCGTINSPRVHFQLLDHDCFRCHCPNCKAWWGILKCSKGHRLPVLFPREDFISTSDKRYDWVDRLYGSDILSLPDISTNGVMGFVCPDCGNVTCVN